MKLGTHDLCANMQKTVKWIFKILILKFVAIFLNFKSAVDLSRVTGLL